MKAMQLGRLGSLDEYPEPLSLVDIPRPVPAAGEVLIKISACGVCHTELDEIEGRTPPPTLPIVPGHEVIGRVAATGKNVEKLQVGDRVGVGWIYDSDGSEAENLSDRFRATGRDANGGYAQYMVVREAYAHRVPQCFSDQEAAPLLCAGSVGYRALRLTRLVDGEVLGLTGFGGSGHLVLRMTRFLFPKSPILVFARSASERQFARDLGADWAGDTAEQPPEAPHAIIDTTPAWLPVIAALECLRPGGRLVINAIRKEDRDASKLAGIDYARHLWLEKSLQTVANVTGHDIASFLRVAAQAKIRPEIETYPLEAANRALGELRAGGLRGAKVLTIA